MCLGQVFTDDDMNVATHHHFMIRKVMKNDYPEVIMHLVCNHEIQRTYEPQPFIMWDTARNLDLTAAVGEVLYTLTITLSSTKELTIMEYCNTGIIV